MDAKNSESGLNGVRGPNEVQNVGATALPELRDLVRQYRVCWETFKEEAVVNNKIREIGFELDLLGTHEPGTNHVSPGCEYCKPVQSALRQIAEWILPRENRSSTYEVNIDAESLNYAPLRKNRPDVRLTIRILHRSDFDRPIDECEVRCLKDMEKALSELGARKGTWRPSAQKETALS